jgi:hypothetical protein
MRSQKWIDQRKFVNELVREATEIERLMGRWPEARAERTFLQAQFLARATWS